MRGWRELGADMRGGAYFFAEVGPQAPATLATPTTGVLAVLAPCRWHAGAQESQPVAPPQLAAVGAGHALARLGDEYPASHVGAWGVSKVGQVSAWVQGAQGLARIAGQGHGAPPPAAWTSCTMTLSGRSGRAGLPPWCWPRSGASLASP